VEGGNSSVTSWGSPFIGGEGVPLLDLVTGPLEVDTDKEGNLVLEVLTIWDQLVGCGEEGTD